MSTSGVSGTLPAGFGMNYVRQPSGLRPRILQPSMVRQQSPVIPITSQLRASQLFDAKYKQTLNTFSLHIGGYSNPIIAYCVMMMYENIFSEIWAWLEDYLADIQCKIV